MNNVWRIFVSGFVASLVVLGSVFASILIGKFTGSMDGAYTINVMERVSGAASAFIWVYMYRLVNSSLTDAGHQEDAA